MDDGIESRYRRKTLFDESAKVCGIYAGPYKTSHILTVIGYSDEFTEHGAAQKPAGQQVAAATASTNFKELDRQIVEEHNKLRANPRSYIPHLQEMLGYFSGDSFFKPGSLITQPMRDKRLSMMP